MAEYKWHPAANIFPMLGEDELNELAQDIRQNGQKVPVVIHPDGRVLDGRNRVLACRLAGVPVKEEVWRGDGSPIEFVLSLNLHRRQLSSAQKACVAVKAEEVEAELKAEAEKNVGGRPRKGEKPNQKIGEVSDAHHRQTDHKMAEIAGTNRQYVNDARKLKTEAPELFERVESGRMKIQDAKKELRSFKQDKQAKTDPWPAIEEQLKDRLDDGETIVVNVDKQHHITAYARSKGKLVMVDRSSPWGNVFVIGDDGDRDDVCEKYGNHYLPNKNKLMAQIGSLKGKALGCHCAPLRCHADEIAAIVEGF